MARLAWATTTISRMTLKDGRVFEVYSKPQLIDGKPVGRVWSHRDVTKQMQVEAQLVRLANNDALTGLLNRRRLQERH